LGVVLGISVEVVVPLAMVLTVVFVIVNVARGVKN
jgi:type IV secretory pathway VirB3-like protein